MIELAQCAMDKDLYFRMAQDYVDTLSTYDNAIRWDEPSWAQGMWSSQFLMENRTAQGFAMTQRVHFNLFPDALYIAEFYVVPEARRKHLGTDAVRALTRDWSGDVFLYILDKNTPARIFWTDVEAELGWRQIQRPEIHQEPGCELRVYKT